VRTLGSYSAVNDYCSGTIGLHHAYLAPDCGLRVILIVSGFFAACAPTSNRLNPTTGFWMGHAWVTLDHEHAIDLTWRGQRVPLYKHYRSGPTTIMEPAQDGLSYCTYRYVWGDLATCSVAT